MTAEDDILDPEIQEMIDEIQTPHNEVVEVPFEPINIDLSRGMQLRVYVDETYAAIIHLNGCEHPTVFRKAGQMVRIMRSVGGRRETQMVDEDILFNLLTYRVNYFNTPTLRQQMQYQIDHPGQLLNNIPKNPPMEIVKNLLCRNSYDELPELIGIASCPIVDLNTGNIRTDSHYDPIAKMYYGYDPSLVIPPIPTVPSAEDVSAAYDLLKETVTDFPFVDQNSSSNMIGVLITGVIRPAILGHIPAFLISKPAAGTGAGLLCDTISTIVAGSNAAMMTLPTTKDGDEFKKVVTSILMSGSLLTFVDNIEDKVDLSDLAALLTMPIFNGRMLGGNRMLSTPHRNIWILNGNNVSLGGDMGRRVVYVRIDANLERPWLRANGEFTHPDQIAWITENRGRILGAIYTIVKSWVIAGKPLADDKIPQMGSFEEWRSVVGGIIQHMGVTGFLSNASEVLEKIDTEAPEFGDFVEGLYNRLILWDKNGFRMCNSEFAKPVDTGVVLFTTRDVINIIVHEETENIGDKKQLLKDLLPAHLLDCYIANRNFNVNFGHILNKNADRIINNNYKLSKSDSHSHNKRLWKIQKMTINQPNK